MVTNVKPEAFEVKGFGSQFPFEALKDPGCYLSNWSGHLIRLPNDGVKEGRSPVIEILGKEPMLVTMLSHDPFLSITKARMLAADLDLPVNF